MNSDDYEAFLRTKLDEAGIIRPVDLAVFANTLDVRFKLDREKLHDMFKTLQPDVIKFMWKPHLPEIHFTLADFAGMDITAIKDTVASTYGVTMTCTDEEFMVLACQRVGETCTTKNPQALSTALITLSATTSDMEQLLVDISKPRRGEKRSHSPEFVGIPDREDETMLFDEGAAHTPTATEQGSSYKRAVHKTDATHPFSARSVEQAYTHFVQHPECDIVLLPQSTALAGAILLGALRDAEEMGVTTSMLLDPNGRTGAPQWAKKNGIPRYFGGHAVNALLTSPLLADDKMNNMGQTTRRTDHVIENASWHIVVKNDDNPAERDMLTNWHRRANTHNLKYAYYVPIGGDNEIAIWHAPSEILPIVEQDNDPWQMPSSDKAVCVKYIVPAGCVAVFRRDCYLGRPKTKTHSGFYVYTTYLNENDPVRDRQLYYKAYLQQCARANSPLIVDNNKRLKKYKGITLCPTDREEYSSKCLNLIKTPMSRLAVNFERMYSYQNAEEMAELYYRYGMANYIDMHIHFPTSDAFERGQKDGKSKITGLKHMPAIERGWNDNNEDDDGDEDMYEEDDMADFIVDNNAMEDEPVSTDDDDTDMQGEDVVDKPDLPLSDQLTEGKRQSICTTTQDNN